MSARSRSRSRSRSAPTSDIIEIPRKLEGCVVQTHHPVKPGDLDRYYNYAPFYFNYNESGKKHIFIFHIGLVTPDNKQILKKRLTYGDLRMKNERGVLTFENKIKKAIHGIDIKDWFLPLLEIIKSKYAMSILASLIQSVQFDITEDSKIMPKPSNIDSAIEPEVTIRREVQKKKGPNMLVEIDQEFINNLFAVKTTDTSAYNIYFTFQMKPDAIAYDRKRIITKFCIKKADGSEETRYITQLPSGEYIFTQEEGKPRVYNRAEPPFRYVGGMRKTRRRQRQRRNQGL